MMLMALRPLQRYLMALRLIHSDTPSRVVGGAHPVVLSRSYTCVVTFVFHECGMCSFHASTEILYDANGLAASTALPDGLAPY